MSDYIKTKSGGSISRSMGIPLGTVYAIKSGQNWGWVQP